MRTSFLYFLLMAAPLFAQTDFFLQEEKVLPPAIEQEEDSIEGTSINAEESSEPSLVIVLGQNTIPDLPYSKRLRGYKGVIDWEEIPDLVFPKEEIKVITILQRELIKKDGNNLTFSPSKWLFKAENWEMVYQGLIPYLEELLFLDDEQRLRLTSQVVLDRENTELGYRKDKYTKAYGFYQAVNTPSPKAVEKIIIVSAEDNSYINSLKTKLDNTPPLLPFTPSSAEGVDIETQQAAEKVFKGYSIFDNN